MEYCLVKDESGHWYIIPADKYNEALDYFELIEEYWFNPKKFNYIEPEEPNYLIQLDGGYNSVIFKEYRLK